MVKLTHTLRTALLWFGWGEFTGDTEWTKTPRYVFDYGAIRIYPVAGSGNLVSITGKTIEKLVTSGYLVAIKDGNTVKLRLAAEHRGKWIREGAKLDWRYKQCARLRNQIDILTEKVDGLFYWINRQVSHAAVKRRNPSTTLTKAVAPVIKRLSPSYQTYIAGLDKLKVLQKKLEVVLNRNPTDDELIVYMVSKKLDNPDQEQ